MWRSLFIFLLSVQFQAQAAQVENLALPSGAELEVQRYSAPTGPILLWLTGQYGTLEAEQRAAAQLAEKGVEVHLADWLAPYFLPQLPASLAQVPDADLVNWLSHIQQRYPDRELTLLASGHAAQLLLRAAQVWRQQSGKTPAASVLLFPLLYREVDAGNEADYAPVVDATCLNLAMLIPKASAGYWWRDRLKTRLEAAGSTVQMTVLPGMRDGFYRRSDANEAEIATGAHLGDRILELLQPILHKAQP